MSFNAIKANLNLYAVLKNLEDLVAYDEEIGKVSKDWSMSIQFSVKKGPKAYVIFRDGKCEVGRGKCRRPAARLFFTSPAHLNKMFDGKANPIPTKGFTKLNFLTKQFPKATDKMEYYLKPTDELLQNPHYLEMNTRLTLNTAAFALKELFEMDPIGRLNAPHIPDGVLLMKVLPEGPAAHLKFNKGHITAHKGDVSNPSAMMLFRGTQVANDLLNGKCDAFAAIATGDVIMKGRVPMIEATNIVLDRIQMYLA